jgi:glutamyl-tRNA synthetase
MYRGRLAPSPTGWLHLGHARTFWTAQQRAIAAAGALVLRNEDLDARRFRLEFVDAMLEDLRWFGFQWQEGPDCGGPFGPYSQSERGPLYRAAWEKLRESGWIYPCRCTHGDVLRALQAPHAGEEEPVYPGTCRPKAGTSFKVEDAEGANWRFRVPDGEKIVFADGFCGSQQFQAGRDFGDFVVWRRDNVPSYQLAVVVDDAAMKITEVVRGADLPGTDPAGVLPLPAGNRRVRRASGQTARRLEPSELAGQRRDAGRVAQRVVRDQGEHS